MAYVRGNKFVYRSRRIDGKVKAEYIGLSDSPLTKMELILDEEKRVSDQKEKQETASMATACQDDIERLFDETTEAMKTVLDEAGYQQHDRGAWRKRKKTDE